MEKLKGRWIAMAPDVTKRGFHRNELLSPWRKWEEDYEAEVPEQVKVLTVAVDIQDDRFEIEVSVGELAKSHGELNTMLFMIHGDLMQPQVWQELEEYLSRTWCKEDGKHFGIVGTFMESGGLLRPESI